MADQNGDGGQRGVVLHLMGELHRLRHEGDSWRLRLRLLSVFVVGTNAAAFAVVLSSRERFRASVADVITVAFIVGGFGVGAWLGPYLLGWGTRRKEKQEEIEMGHMRLLILRAVAAAGRLDLREFYGTLYGQDVALANRAVLALLDSEHLQLDGDSLIDPKARHPRRVALLPPLGQVDGHGRSEQTQPPGDEQSAAD